MNSLRKFSLLGSFVVCLIFGCDQGLIPEPPPQYGISGTIYFRNWPPPDSVRDLAIAALKAYPQGNLFIEFIQQKAPFILFSNVPYGAVDTTYVLLFDPSPPGVYEFIAIAQRFGPERFNPDHWRVAGVYYKLGDTTRAGSVFVSANAIMQGIDLFVDFNNPPPPP